MTDSHLKFMSEAMDRIFDAFERKPVKRVSAGMMTVTWSFPNTDCKLRIECEYDAFGVPLPIDVCDATGERYPYEDIWFRGKPLEDILIEYLRSTPADELRRA